jgi:hypothetical protein
VSAERLRAMVAEATPGPWFYDSYAGVHSQPYAQDDDCDYSTVASVWAGPVTQTRGGTATNPTDARLIALAPELAALLADMADGFRAFVENADDSMFYDTPDFLARLDALIPAEST